MELRDALAGYAGWLGHGHPERADAWLARLEVNRPELEAFRAAATPDDPAHLAIPASLAPASGEAAAGEPLPADAPAALERARARPELNAFTWLPDRLDTPQQGFLRGVPVAVKDLMRVQGAPLTGGGKAMGREVAQSDAEVVARMKRAGLVVMGLTNLHEFAYGITSDNVHFGRVVNPAAPDRIPGGSSGGSAAAIAAGIVRLAVGTDTGGSIRVPAACCGIAGFKPSYDAVPRAGVVDLAHSLDHVGPLGKEVEDCAALFAAMLGLDAIPHWVWPGAKGRVFARLGGYFASPLHEEVRAALEEAARALEGDGARVIERDVEGAHLAPAMLVNTIAPEATAFHAQRLADHGADFGEEVRVRLEMGLFLPGPWYVKAQRMRTRLIAAFDAVFADADFLLCPTMRAPAPVVGAARVEIEGRPFGMHAAVTNFTMPFNLAGLPAAAVPWSTSREGVPISMQVIGRRGRDWDTLAAAQRLQAAARR
jgi:Asp-tRNA(Asn)/Glu-tRNA(Gln) amidotransferase A subunit family amidase